MEGSVKQYKESAIPHLLNAAKSLIPKKWQKVESPKIWEWINAIEGTNNMECLRHSGEEKSEGLTDKWESWKAFKKTWRYVEVIS